MVIKGFSNFLSQHTISEIADVLSVSRQTVLNWKKQLAFPDINQILKLCSYYNITVGDMFGDPGYDMKLQNIALIQENKYLKAKIEAIRTLIDK